MIEAFDNLARLDAEEAEALRQDIADLQRVNAALRRALRQLLAHGSHHDDGTFVIDAPDVGDLIGQAEALV